MRIFNFLKPKLNSLTKSEQIFAKNLNSHIREDKEDILSDAHLNYLSTTIYELSSIRAKIKPFNFNEEIGLNIIIEKPIVIKHSAIHQAIPKILINMLPVIIFQYRSGKNEKETLEKIESLLLPLFIETSKKIKEL